MTLISCLPPLAFWYPGNMNKASEWQLQVAMYVRGRAMANKSDSHAEICEFRKTQIEVAGTL